MIWNQAVFKGHLWGIIFRWARFFMHCIHTIAAGVLEIIANYIQHTSSERIQSFAFLAITVSLWRSHYFVPVNIDEMNQVLVSSSIFSSSRFFPKVLINPRVSLKQTKIQTLFFHRRIGHVNHLAWRVTNVGLIWNRKLIYCTAIQCSSAISSR